MSQVERIDPSKMSGDEIISTIQGPQRLRDLVVFVEETEVPCGVAVSTSYLISRPYTSGVTFLELARRDQEIRVKEGILTQGISKL